MRRTVLTASLLVMLATGASGAQPAIKRDADSDSQWLLVAYVDKDAPFHSGDVPLHPAAGGFALTVVDGLWNLVPATLKANVPKDNPDLVTITATPADAPVYVRLPGLTAGKVDTPDMRFKGVDRDLSRMAVGIPFKGVPYKFELKAGQTWLTDGTSRQLILEGPVKGESGGERDEHSARLIWAGDLDRDGKLDFIISDWFDDGGTMCVWLSSRAASGQLAGEAACMDRDL